MKPLRRTRLILKLLACGVVIVCIVASLMIRSHNEPEAVALHKIKCESAARIFQECANEQCEKLAARVGNVDMGGTGRFEYVTPNWWGDSLVENGWSLRLSGPDRVVRIDISIVCRLQKGWFPSSYSVDIQDHAAVDNAAAILWLQSEFATVAIPVTVRRADR